MLKRYIVFAWKRGPQGGWNDILKDKNKEPLSFDTLEEAKEAESVWIGDPDYRNSHIVDLHTGKIAG
jgi:hypothetical protein